MEEEKIKIFRTCPMCGKVSELPLEQHEEKDYLSYELGGMFIQDAMPFLNPFEREFIKTGYCVNCQELLFGRKYTGKRLLR